MVRRTVAALAMAALLAGCQQSAGDRPSRTLEIVNCGVTVQVPERPQRIVAVEGAAETLFALGAGERTAGWFGGKQADLPPKLKAQAELSKRLGDGWPTPSLEALTATQPDLVVLQAYSTEAGVTRERLTELGVPSLVLSDGCDAPTSTLDAFYGDVDLLARILGEEARGRQLVADWKDAIAQATRSPLPSEPSVLMSHGQDPAKPMVFGGSGLADSLVAAAGGKNIFTDTAKSFLTPNWEEVLSRNPAVIADGSGGGAEGTAALRAYLRGDTALARIAAVRADRFLTLPYEQTSAGPQLIDGIVALAAFLRAE